MTTFVNTKEYNITQSYVIPVHNEDNIKNIKIKNNLTELTSNDTGQTYNIIAINNDSQFAAPPIGWLVRSYNYERDYDSHKCEIKKCSYQMAEYIVYEANPHLKDVHNIKDTAVYVYTLSKTDGKYYFGFVQRKKDNEWVSIGGSAYGGKTMDISYTFLHRAFQEFKEEASIDSKSIDFNIKYAFKKQYSGKSSYLYCVLCEMLDDVRFFKIFNKDTERKYTDKQIKYSGREIKASKSFSIDDLLSKKILYSYAHNTFVKYIIPMFYDVIITNKKGFNVNIDFEYPIAIYGNFKGDEPLFKFYDLSIDGEPATYHQYRSDLRMRIRSRKK